MRSASFIFPFLVAAGVSSTGCSAVEPDASGAGYALEGSIGVLHVERSYESADGHTVLRAAFARYHGIEGDAVLRLLGSDAAVGLGQCAIDTSDELAEGELGAMDADVELVDVGALDVSVADTEARLSPRTFPDLASVLAGVFYAESFSGRDAALAWPEAEVDEYRFVAEGSAEVGAFEVVVPAPAQPVALALLGADGTSASLESGLTEVSLTGALTLLWDGEDPRDLIEIEIVSGGSTLACLAHDEGSFRIEEAALATISADSDARLTVRRVRLAPFDAPGIDSAFARLAASRSVPLSIR